MLIKEIDLSRLMFHAQQIKEQKTKEKVRENKKAKIGSFNFTQPKSESGNRPQFCSKSLVPISSSTSAPVPKFKHSNNDRAPNSRSQGSVISAQTSPLNQKCRRNHQGIYRSGSNICFGCSKLGHTIKECPQVGFQSQHNCNALTQKGVPYRQNIGQILSIKVRKPYSLMMHFKAVQSQAQSGQYHQK